MVEAFRKDYVARIIRVPDKAKDYLSVGTEVWVMITNEVLGLVRIKLPHTAALSYEFYWAIKDLDPVRPTRTLRSGTLRKLYVDRKNAAKLLPPICVEDTGTGEKIHATGVTGWIGSDEAIGFEFKWSGNNADAPALWIETDLHLEVTL